jgi:hypothetical protein
MTKNQIQFIQDNKKIYIKDFTEYYLKNYDYVPTEENIKDDFKVFMEDYKNINYVDYRYSIIKEIINKCIDKILRRYERIY